MFSILMCSWNREKILPNSLNSVMNQTFKDFEFLIVDDGSTDNTGEVLQEYADKYPNFRVLPRHEKGKERVFSRKELMKEAQGKWIYIIDSDDEMIYGALEIMKHNIEKYPEYKMFNWGLIYTYFENVLIKEANELPIFNGKHDHFDTGQVGTGGFIFHRDCLDALEGIPDIESCQQLAHWFGYRVDKWFDQNKPGVSHQLYCSDDRDGRTAKWCGNPWGDDYVLAWLITRKYLSKKLTILPYVLYIRTENWQYENL